MISQAKNLGLRGANSDVYYLLRKNIPVFYFIPRPTLPTGLLFFLRLA